MFKHMHTFESYGDLDMPVNPSFSAYNEFKQYMSDPEVKELVNTLNNLWWEMEQGNVEDEVEMNEYGQQLEELEEEIRELINNKKVNVDTDDDDDSDGIPNDAEVLNNVRYFKRMVDNSELDIVVLSEDPELSGDKVKFDVEIDGDQYKIILNEGGDLVLIDEDRIAYMGNIFDREQDSVLTKFKEFMNVYGEDYNRFFDDNAANM